MKKLFLCLTLVTVSLGSNELAAANSNEKYEPIVVTSKENAPVRTITIWGRFRNLMGINGGVAWGCTHMPVVCAQYEISEEGPLQQNGTFRATAFNPDGTVADYIEYTDVIVSRGATDDEVILNFILP